MPATLLWIVAIALMLIGLMGLVLPLLPGVPLIFTGMVLAAYIDNFQRVGGVSIAILAALTVIALAVDLLSSAWGAKRVGASRRAVWGAFFGTLVGVFFGIVGLIFGPFLGALIGELSVHGRFEQAGRVGVATSVGLLIGTVLKLAIAFAMLGFFVLVYFIG